MQDLTVRSNTLALEPVEDPDMLDQRRVELNMKPHQADLDQMAAGFCGLRTRADD